MVTLLPFGAGVVLIALALSGLFEVTNYTAEQRARHRRRMQAFTYGNLAVIGLGLASLYYGLANADLPLWLFGTINVVVLSVLVVQWDLRRRIEDED